MYIYHIILNPNPGIKAKAGLSYYPISLTIALFLGFDSKGNELIANSHARQIFMIPIENLIRVKTYFK